MAHSIYYSGGITEAGGWIPFQVAAQADSVRALGVPGGVEDRLRLVAFAEIQARDLFRWGAERFAAEIPAAWGAKWREFAEVEDLHAQLLLTRMQELGLDPGARKVSNKLHRLCHSAADAVLFLFLLAGAEERGRDAGLVLGKQMQAVDAQSAALFRRIAEEEMEHVAMANHILSQYDVGMLRAKARACSAALGSEYGVKG